MNPTIFFSVCSLFYSILLIVISKRLSVENKENKIFKYLVFANLIGLIFEVSGLLLAGNYDNYRIINNLILRGMLIYHMVWISLFVLYVLAISNGKRFLEAKKTKTISIIIVAVVSMINIFLPFTCAVKNGVVVYTYGTAVDFVFLYSFLCDIFCFIVMFKNIKNVPKYKYSPLFVLLSVGTVVSMIQSAYPHYLLATSMHTFVSYVIYVTIETKLLKEAKK